ncbi:MAG TPA: hypothetical protein VEH84_03515 [Alphaproteobacteria bacterium]|nr:hypothetical protein [Alphaproteobacteria bacterium]
MAGVATERVVVLVSPGEKRLFERKAKEMNLPSVSELVRRSVEAYRAEDDTAELGALVRALNESHSQAIAALEAAEAELAETRAYFAERRG